ncbi:MAG: alanine dehydrogenase, partial [Fidelibacterota bacterium]
NRLKYLNEIMPPNVITLYSNSMNINEILPRTDLVIGAVLIVGAKAPRLITREMLKMMKPGSVIVDVAVDQGGCIETCHPTTHAQPTFIVDGIVHYCVANMPGAVPYTSTLALTNVTFPYISKIAKMGSIQYLKSDVEFRSGLNIYKGIVTHKGVADAFNLEYFDPNKLFD